MTIWEGLVVAGGIVGIVAAVASIVASAVLGKVVARAVETGRTRGLYGLALLAELWLWSVGLAVAQVLLIILIQSDTLADPIGGVIVGAIAGALVGRIVGWLRSPWDAAWRSLSNHIRAAAKSSTRSDVVQRYNERKPMLVQGSLRERRRSLQFIVRR